MKKSNQPIRTAIHFLFKAIIILGRKVVLVTWEMVARHIVLLSFCQCNSTKQQPKRKQQQADRKKEIYGIKMMELLMSVYSSLASQTLCCTSFEPGVSLASIDFLVVRTAQSPQLFQMNVLLLLLDCKLTRKTVSPGLFTPETVSHAKDAYSST